MMNYISLIAFLWCFQLNAQTVNFQQAYASNPEIPRGVLEAVSWAKTRMRHLDENVPESCAGLPKAYGIMGLIEDGKDYFKETGHLVGSFSSSDWAAIKQNVNLEVLAYANAFNHYFQLEEGSEAQRIYGALFELSEIPTNGLENMYAKESSIYEIFQFLRNETFANQHGFIAKSYDLKNVFGENNLKVLSASRIQMTSNSISTELGHTFAPSTLKSDEFDPAIWDPAPSCNYSSRSGTAVSAITIHTIQGTYAGAISWAKNCNSNVSYHYVVRSSDGQVTQMVMEADKAWHVGSANPYTIGYEHDGYVDDPVWYTDELYNSSAAISRDIVNSGYGIPPLRTYYGPSSSGTNTLGNCTKIKGHQHYPNQTHTDPGINWDWERYYKLINNDPSYTLYSDPSGQLFDSGGEFNNYEDDERLFWLIEPQNAESVTVEFTSFDIEVDYDYLFIYDGNTVDAPLIGVYNGTTSPGTVTSTGGALLIEFRSDCATMNPGWALTYSSVQLDVNPPSTSVQTLNDWQTTDFNVSIVSTDDQTASPLTFELVADRPNLSTSWQSNLTSGYVREGFDNEDNWSSISGTYSLSNSLYTQTEGTNENTNAYLLIDQTGDASYLYEWNQRITSTNANQRAGIHFMCSDPTLANRGNSYFVYLRETHNTVQIYSVTNDTYSLETSSACTVNLNEDYNVKVTYSPISGEINVYINDDLKASWTDDTPLISGTAISLRTGGCEVEFNDLSMYRESTGSITVVNAALGMARYESLGGVTTAIVEAISIDDADNWSLKNSSQYLIDRSGPSMTYLHDGTSSDIDTSTIAQLFVNYAIDDPHSFVTGFEISLGTTSGGTDILDWTAIGVSNNYSFTLPSPIEDQVYYYSVRATNGANLTSEFTSDGQRYVSSAKINEHPFNSIELYPNPTTDYIQVSNLNQVINYQLMDMQGKVVQQGRLDVNNSSIDLSNYAAGTYQLILIDREAYVAKKIVKK